MSETQTHTTIRTIRRYAGRRLCDPRMLTYVSLADIAGRIRDGETFDVVEAGTGERIMDRILTQIIAAKGERDG